uniref:Uncharacterized protein n=1 Tax=Anguilla anguilla TaxID=7936 RepID=A0A0E9TBW6_ANGAN
MALFKIVVVLILVSWSNSHNTLVLLIWPLITTNI